MRKIVQVSALPVTTTHGHGCVYALCDDNTLWRGWATPDEKIKWYPLNNVPQESIDKALNYLNAQSDTIPVVPHPPNVHPIGAVCDLRECVWCGRGD